MIQVILASGSATRKKLLKQIGLDFITDASRIEEKLNPRLKPRGNAEQLSLLKAREVAKRYSGAVIIAADTFAVIDGEIIGKPKDKTEAERILKKLSGRQHCAVTAFTILDTRSGRSVTKSAETKVYFRKLTHKEIKDYILSKECFGNAGAYAISGKAACFIERIEGEPFNIEGLPLCLLTEVLKKFR